MAKKSQCPDIDPQSDLVAGFKVLVDGREYGPFPIKAKRRFAYLNGKKGIKIIPVSVPKGSLSLSLSLSLSRKAPAKQPEQASLLEGIDFTPVPKR